MAVRLCSCPHAPFISACTSAPALCDALRCRIQPFLEQGGSAALRRARPRSRRLRPWGADPSRRAGQPARSHLLARSIGSIRTHGGSGHPDRAFRCPDLSTTARMASSMAAVIRQLPPAARTASADSEVRPGPRLPTLRPCSDKIREAGPEAYPQSPCRLGTLCRQHPQWRSRAQNVQFGVSGILGRVGLACACGPATQLSEPNRPASRIRCASSSPSSESSCHRRHHTRNPPGSYLSG